MSGVDPDRAQLRRAREQLEGWKYDARDAAFSEFFERSDPALTTEDLQLLDEIDSDLTRRDGSGLWGADEYGIIAEGPLDADTPLVVCTYHPEIPDQEYRGAAGLDEATRENFNEVLWEYCERVAGHIQSELEAFLESTRSD
ncbi:hypothetical protein [Natrialba sp. PRR66]|uniref:DUF7539 family protein n=1 Tax=Natrialba sp. PRR66 TaxID=3098146 RepID=UPI002B1E6D8B|nr:hypothetical protein [Natrialba sp. PRR66]